MAHRKKWVFPLNIVIFHRYANVYHRVGIQQWDFTKTMGFTKYLWHFGILFCWFFQRSGLNKNHGISPKVGVESTKMEFEEQMDYQKSGRIIHHFVDRDRDRQTDRERERDVCVFPISTSIYRGFSLARFDSRRVTRKTYPTKLWISPRQNGWMLGCNGCIRCYWVGKNGSHVGMSWVRVQHDITT